MSEKFSPSIDINKVSSTKEELSAFEIEVKKTQYEQFCKNYPKIRMNFSYFCEYTKLFPLEKIGAESLAEICEKPIEPSYVNSCIRNKECLGEFYFS